VRPQVRSIPVNSQKQFGKKQEVQTDSGSGIFYKGTPAYKNIRLIKKLEPYIFLAVILGIFVPMSCQMGLRNMFRTMMYTAHDLLINTVFYIMAICVLAGALSDMLAEFGVIHVMQRMLQPLMKPLFNLPGAASLAAVMTFFSDNPAVLSLAQDKKFSRYFKKYQFVSLTNFGTSFGMGLIVITIMMGYGYMWEPLLGFFAAVCGGLISTRLMQRFCRPVLGEDMVLSEEEKASFDAENIARLNGDVPEDKKTGLFQRCLNCMLDGGKKGVDIGLAIIPGVLVISTAVMMITMQMPEGGYTGAAYEGTGWLPMIGRYIYWPVHIIFGFENPENIAFPLTALGAVGSAVALVPKLNVTPSDIAVFTGIGMCWSGFLSTHTAMLDNMGYRPLISKALTAHTIGGLCAGIIARYLYLLIMFFR
jgi:hypothetical protein